MAPHTRSPRHPTHRRKAVAVILENARANVHAILSRADPAILSCAPNRTDPVPVPAVVAAINHAGQWPPHLLRSPRLPRALTYVRQTTALMALQLSDDPPRTVARALGRFDRSTILLGAKLGRTRLLQGEHAALDLFAAALVTLENDHPGSHARLDDNLRQAFRNTLQRHQTPPSPPSPDI